MNVVWVLCHIIQETVSGLLAVFQVHMFTQVFVADCRWQRQGGQGCGGGVCRPGGLEVKGVQSRTLPDVAVLLLYNQVRIFPLVWVSF